MAEQGTGDIIQAFRAVPTSIISDNLKRLAGPVGLRPFHKSGTLCGTALTVRTRAGDNRALHDALDVIRPGQVLVVDGGGDVTRALVGEIMKEIAISKHAAGFVIDGAIRDSDAFGEGIFPCFAKAATHHGPFKEGPGEIGVPVSVGGWVVSPSDIVVGDLDGIVTFPAAIAASLLEACRKHAVREGDTIRSIREGRYVGGYAAKSKVDGRLPT